MSLQQVVHLAGAYKMLQLDNWLYGHWMVSVLRAMEPTFIIIYDDLVLDAEWCSVDVWWCATHTVCCYYSLMTLLTLVL